MGDGYGRHDLESTRGMSTVQVGASVYLQLRLLYSTYVLLPSLTFLSFHMLDPFSLSSHPHSTVYPAPGSRMTVRAAKRSRQLKSQYQKVQHPPRWSGHDGSGIVSGGGGEGADVQGREG